jgi:hypothetical protein
MTVTLGSAVTVTGVLVSFAKTLADDDLDIEHFVLEIGVGADGLLTRG